MAVRKDFFNSVFNLTSLYGLTAPVVTAHPFPFDIATAYEQAQTSLRKVAPSLELIVIQDETRAACVATVEVLALSNKLYYIPARPVYDLLKKKEQKNTANLILSVFSYLYHIVKIPYYREWGNYLNYCYEQIEEWYLYSGESSKKEIRDNEREFNKIKNGGDRILTKIKLPSHLQQFEKRLKAYIPADEQESEILQVAKSAFALWQSYPNRSFHSGLPERLLHPEVEERIGASCYLSFFWDSEDYIYDTLMEYINADLQEYAVIDEPIAIQLFDTPQAKPEHDLTFETKLFQLLDDLCDVLNKLS